MKDILVVLTGGTIGSRIRGQWVDVNDTSAYTLSFTERPMGRRNIFRWCSLFPY